MQQVSDIYASAGNKLSQIKAILYLLQSNLDELKEEVDRSYELLKIGEMTELTKKIEETLTNPVDSAFQVSESIDVQVKGIVDILVKSFFHTNKQFIKTAYRSKTPFNDLHYCVVLNDDNIDNRGIIFEYFDKYDLLEIAHRFPVFFQFVPAELEEKILYAEKINLH